MNGKIAGALIVFVVLLTLKMLGPQKEYLVTNVEEYSQDLTVVAIESCYGRKYARCSVLFENDKKEQASLTIYATEVPLVNQAIKNKELFTLDFVRIHKGKTSELCLRSIVSKSTDKTQLESLFEKDSNNYQIGSIPPLCVNHLY